MDVVDSNNKLLARTFLSSHEHKFLVHTPPEFPIQVGFNRALKGKKFPPHFHRGESSFRHEVLLVLEGRVRVDVFDESAQKVSSVTLGPGEAIILTCGQGISILEDALIFEVKQGPYPGPGKDKQFINESFLNKE